MILTALVQTKGGTLVVDLPRDRIDLEMKIRSVGIERLSDQIRIIDDEEKSDISVKLFGESCRCFLTKTIRCLMSTRHCSSWQIPLRISATIWR